MELEHRFEVPVGVDKAWPALLDLDVIGPCFPGASVDSHDGDEFTGSVKVKIGPVQLNYKGKAKFVEIDHLHHRATIEANGAAARSGSTATMLVNATATAIAPNRTAVDLVTTLSITGREARFTRQVMVEVGNKLIGGFADCVSSKLTGKTAGGVTLLNVTNPDEVAAEVAAGPPAWNGTAATPSAAPSGEASPTQPRGAHAAPDSPRAATRRPEVDPIDLLAAGRGPLLERLVPIVAGVIALLIIIKLFRRRK